MRKAYADVRRAWTNTNLMDRFDLYFSALMAITMHPGYSKPGSIQPSPIDIAYLALEMIEVRNSIEDKIKCQSFQQAQQ